jgi:methylphosphotriester-DNA--protein-cysteine methyltransferase
MLEDGEELVVVSRTLGHSTISTTAETGLSPMAWLADARIDRAREILETTTEPIENIGRLTGLGAPVSVRAAFHRRIGVSPKEYRAVWRGSSTSATASATVPVPPISLSPTV